MAGQNLYNIIEQCNICNTSYRPFLPSKIENRKCAIITLSPSYQAFTRPLFSIRFFRVLLMALLGENPVFDNNLSIIDYFFQNIYWTHYNKCYCNNKAKDVSDRCYDNGYIRRELDIVRPEIVVVIGDVTSEKILNLKVSQNEAVKETILDGVPYLSVNFPKYGIEDEFIYVRKKLSKYINGIDVERSSSLDDGTVREKNKMAVHIKSEIDYLKSLLNYINRKNSIATISAPHIYKESIYQSAFYSFALEAYSIIEQNLILIAHERGKSYQENVSLTYMYVDIINAHGNFKKNDVTNRIEKIRKIRNGIAHRKGIIDLSRNDQKLEEIKGSLDGVFASNKYSYISIDYYQCKNWILLIEDIFQSLYILNKRN